MMKYLIVVMCFLLGSCVSESAPEFFNYQIENESNYILKIKCPDYAYGCDGTPIATGETGVIYHFTFLGGYQGEGRPHVISKSVLVSYDSGDGVYIDAAEITPEQWRIFSQDEFNYNYSVTITDNDLTFK